MTNRIIRILPILLIGCGLWGCKESGPDGSQSDAASNIGRSQTYSTYDFNALDFATDTECDLDSPDIFFRFDEPGFNIDNAYLLLLTTLLSEQDPQVARDQFASWGFTDVEMWSHPGLGTRVYIVEHDAFVLVVFRGTTEPIEYVSNAIFITTDADIADKSDGESQAHAGIWDVHTKTRSEVSRLLTQVNDLDKPVIFTGHSRGAALSVLQAAEFAKQGGYIESVYTFAQPRLGNSQFSDSLAQLIGERYYRIEFEHDVTPRVPPSKDMAQPLYDEGYIPLWLADMIEALDYDYDPGEVYLLSDAGYLDLDTDMHESQLEYWRGLFAAYPDLVLSIPQLMKFFPNNHHPRIYICHLAAQF